MRKLPILGGTAAALTLGAAVVMAASPGASPGATVSTSPAESARARASLGAGAGASAVPSATTQPSTSPSIAPGSSPAPSTSPAPGGGGGTTSGKAPTAAQPTFRAQFRPLQVTGSATVAKKANGHGLVTLRLSGLLDELPWSVRIEAWRQDSALGRNVIAQKRGDDVVRVSKDVLRVRLTKAEMKAFLMAQKSKGVVIYVSDGSRISVATIGTH